MNELTILISSCEKYSDLWDANLHFLEQNWPDRAEETLLVTDAPTDRCYPHVEILCAGVDKEFTERLAAALEQVKTPYLLFLLDDYFLTEKIDQEKLHQSVRFAAREKIDYIRLYPASRHYLHREGAKPFPEDPGFYLRDLREGEYKISLYPGIWKTEFMRRTLDRRLNAWQYEVSLTERAKELDAVCVISNHRELPFLDVIRKGKLLHKAQRTLRNCGVELPNRELMPRYAEMKIQLRTFLRHWLPRSIFLAGKKLGLKTGKSFYSPVQSENKPQS